MGAGEGPVAVRQSLRTVVMGRPDAAGAGTSRTALLPAGPAEARLGVGAYRCPAAWRAHCSGWG